MKRRAGLLSRLFDFSGNGSEGRRAVSYSFEAEFTRNWD